MLVVRERLSGSPGGVGSNLGSPSLGAATTGASELPASGSPAAEQLVLPFELRQKSRLRARLKSGLEVGLFLERGIFLRGSDLLLAEDGTVIEVVAAPETVSTVTERDPTKLARAAYHLGNRHVPVQIGTGWLRYGHDHVLDDMVRGLGLAVVVEQAPFEPEGGAYGGGHSHSHNDGHLHSSGHSREEAPAHTHDHSHGHDHLHGPGHSHDAGHPHGHDHSHEAGHTHGRGFGVLLDKHDDHHH